MKYDTSPLPYTLSCQCARPHLAGNCPAPTHTDADPEHKIGYLIAPYMKRARDYDKLLNALLGLLRKGR